MVSECFSKNNNRSSVCKNSFRIDKNKSYVKSLEVNLSKNTNYYLQSINKNFFVPELNINLKF